MNDLILVTGATGGGGGSGSHVVRQLVAKGKNVRALVHKQDDRSKAIEALDVDVVVGDLLYLDDVRLAMRGVQTGYLVFPLHPTIVSASATFAQAAKEAGLELIVNMSQLPARRDANSPASLNHWLSEEVLNWSGVPVTHIRATFFMEWLLWVAPLIKNTGKMIMPWNADSQYTPVAAEDLGRAIADILVAPQPHAGKTYELVGPQQLSYQDVAVILSRALGKDVPYQQLEAGPFAEKIGLPAYFRDHCRETTKTLSEGFFEVQNNLIEELTGAPPMTFGDFIQKHRAAWA